MQKVNPIEDYSIRDVLNALKKLSLWALLAGGILWQSPLLLFFSGALIGFEYLIGYWASYNCKALHSHKSISPHQLWPGETTILTIEMENRGFLPIFLVTRFDDIAKGLIM